jgi:hypothetical protein
MPYLSHTGIASLASLPGCDHHQAYQVRVLSSHISSASKESGKSSCHPSSEQRLRSLFLTTPRSVEMNRSCRSRISSVSVAIVSVRVHFEARLLRNPAAFQMVQSHKFHAKFGCRGPSAPALLHFWSAPSRSENRHFILVLAFLADDNPCTRAGLTKFGSVQDLSTIAPANRSCPKAFQSTI